jgi:hypothetical protein
MKKKLSFICETLFLIFLPIAIENWARHLFGYDFIFGYVCIVITWVTLGFLVKKNVLILM